MNQQIKTIFAEVQKLSPADREELAELILSTIGADPGIEAAWGEEAHRRWDEHVKTGGKSIDALKAIDEVRDLLRRRDGE